MTWSAQLEHGLSNLLSRVLTDPRISAQVERFSLTRGDLRELASYFGYGSSEHIEIHGPFSPDPIPWEIQDKMGTNTIDRPFVCEIEDAELIGPWALTVAKGNRIVLENALGSVNLLTRSAAKMLLEGTMPVRRNPQRCIEVAVSLVGPWCRGYYHWFSDYLLRLEGIERYVERTGLEPTLLIPESPPQWMRTSLELLGFGSFDWMHWNGDRMRVEKLVVPSLRRQTQFTHQDKGYMFSPSAYRWLRDRIHQNRNINTSGEPCRVFISREKADKRRVVNQERVMQALSKRGFQSYVLEDMPLEEQIELFSRAEVIVGPTGAGLTNMLFAENVSVITLFGSVINACYPVMAESLGFNSGFSLCEPHGLDMRVDPDRLVHLLDTMIETERGR